MRNVALLVDESALDRVLVLGSLPPAGRDLDLLVREPDREALAARLEAAGFVRRGRDLALFEDCTAYAVELIPAEGWLPAAELDDLFAQALPVDGCRKLVRPAPHHALLILERLGMNEKRRARAAAA